MNKKIKRENIPSVIAARTIEANVKNGRENNLCIDFYNNIIRTWHGAFQLSASGFDFKISGREATGYKYFGENDSLEATILVGDIDGESKAFLVAKTDDVKAIVFPIDDLFMFSVVPDGKQLAVYHNHKPFENKMVLLFSNESTLPFVPDILESIKHLKMSDYVSALLENRTGTSGTAASDTTGKPE